VLEVGLQVVGRLEADEQPVGVGLAAPAEVLAHREVYDVRDAAPQVADAREQVLDVLRRASPFTVNSTRWSTKVISFAGYGCRTKV
jgi:hypothetical protein